MSAEAEGGVAAQGDTDASELSVKVYDPVKQGEGMSAYVSYRVEAKTNLPQYQQQVNEVIRRFKDFAWLKSKLEEKNPGVIGKTNTHTHTHTLKDRNNPNDQQRLVGLLLLLVVLMGSIGCKHKTTRTKIADDTFLLLLLLILW